MESRENTKKMVLYDVGFHCLPVLDGGLPLAYMSFLANRKAITLQVIYLPEIR